MNNSCTVRGCEGTRDLDRHIKRFTQLQRSARQTVAQRFAFDEFAGNVMN